jgi:hypothetical protein
VQRLISRNVGIIFKGSGFYCTDHRSNTRLSGSGDTDAEPAAAASDKADAKTPEAKVDAKTPDAKADMTASTQKAG